MSPEEIHRRLQRIHQRIDGLTQSGLAPPDETMEELRTAFEELRVADEELRQQNEELVAAHLQLEMERQRYLDLFELAPDAYVSTDLVGIITEVNQPAARLLGLPQQTLAGRPLATYIASEDRARFRGLLSQREHGSSPTTITLRVHPRQSDSIRAEFTYSVAHDFRGNSVGFRWIIRDVTRQDQLSGQVQKLTSELEQKVADRTADLRAAQRLAEDLLLREQAARHAAEASEAQSRHVQKLESIGVLAGGIAHDFNNLLHVVLGNADIALSHLPPGAPAREPLDEVIRATLRAADLTRQLLAYSGKGAFVIRHLDLSNEVREMATLLRTAIAKQAVLGWELAKELPSISADPTQIRQIVMNLITNASDALGEDGGTITLRTGIVKGEELDADRRFGDPRRDDGNEVRSGAYVYLEIADTGAGMTPDTLNRIFDPFFSTKFSGRGLGLAAVMGIVRAHKGLIRIRTEPGKGTSFRVLFPPLAGPAAKEEKPSTVRSGWRGSGTILVVDDEEAVREVAERMLQEIGFQTILARDGREALDILSQSGDSITGVLLDLSMPRMGGQETFQRLRRDRPDLPVVMMSGYTEATVAEQLGESPHNTGFLQKPFVAEDLIIAFRRFAEAPG